MLRRLLPFLACLSFAGPAFGQAPTPTTAPGTDEVGVPDPATPPQPGPLPPPAAPPAAPPALAAPPPVVRPPARPGLPHSHLGHRPMRMHAPPPPLPAPREGARVHDGFYMRLGTGFGMYREQLENDDDASVHGGDVRGNTIGLASVGEFALGGTLGRGWVLGGGFYTATLLTGHYSDDNDSEGTLPLEMDPDLRDLVVFGPFVDWYPNPRKGFHLQAALGLAALTSRDGGRFDDDDDGYEAFGAGIVLGVGYEWWIGDEWSLGVLARTQAAGLTGEDDDGVRWIHGASASPSLLLTLTYH